MKTKKIIKCFWFYFFILTAVLSVVISNITGIKNEVTGLTFVQTLLIILGRIIMAFLFACIINFVPLILIMTHKLNTRIWKKSKLDKNVDLGKYKDYYRDIIGDYSPAVLSYIDNYEIEDKDLIATLLNLKLKKYIDIDKNEIKILNLDFDGLGKSEKYLLENVNGKYDINTFKNFVIEDALVCNLITNHIIDVKRLILRIILIIPLFIILNLLSSAMESFTGLSFFTVISMVLILIASFTGIILAFIYPIRSMFFLAAYVYNKGFNLGKGKTMSYIRTKKGKEVNKMIKGLNNYIRDFSLLNERNANELVLWSEYLVYSVLFGQNQKIIKEYKNFLN